MIDVLCISDDSISFQEIIAEIHSFEPELEMEIVVEMSSALSWLETHACDCILVGEQALQDQGREYIKELRSRQGEVPVVVLSNQPSALSVQAAFDSGADDFFAADCGEVERIRQANRIAQLAHNYRFAIESNLDGQKLRMPAHYFRTLFDTAPDSVFVKDRQMRYTHVNRAMGQVIGADPEELIGKTDAQILGEDAVAKIIETDQRVLGGEELVEELVAPIGDEDRLFSVIKAPLRNERGAIVGLFGIARDITEHRQKVRELERYREQLDLALGASNSGIWEISFDPDNPFDVSTEEMYQSPQLKKLFGFEDDEFPSSGLAWRERVHPEDLERLINGRAELLEEGAGFCQQEYRFLHKSGEYRWFLTRSKLVRDEHGKPVRQFGIDLDITGHRQAARSLHESRARFREMAENISEMFYLRSKDKLLYLSPSFERIWGISRTEIMDNPLAIFDTVHPDDRDRVLKSFERERSVGGPFCEEFRIVKPDGETRWLRLRTYDVNTIENSQRRIGIAEDITERKLTEEALQASEEKYRLLAQNISDIVFNIDREGNLIYLSPSADRILGSRAQEVIGKSVSHVLTPASAELAMNTIEELKLTEGGSEDDMIPLELEMQTDSGKPVWIEVLSRPIKDKDGRVTSHVGVAREITERMHAEVALRHSEERLQLALEGTKDALWDWLIDGDKFYLGPPWDEMTGYEQGEIEWSLKLLMDGVHPDDLPRQHEAMQAAVRGEIDYTNVDFRFRHKQGHYFWVSCRGKVVDRDERGIAVRISGTVSDITTRIERERELERSRDRLQEQAQLLAATNQELEAFAHTVSHDLRAPLRRICGWISMIMSERSQSADDEEMQYLKMVEQNSREMQQLVDVLLDFARLMRTELKRSEVDIGAMAKELASTLAADVPDREIDFRIEEMPTCLCDANLMKIVVQNLLSNAVKYTGREETGVIELGAENKNGRVVYHVRDNGVGFEQEKVEKLFAPFQRVHPGNEFQGLGIGLATVQRIIHRHGGRIWAEGEPGVGAAFYFTIGREENGLAKSPREDN